MHLLNLFFNVFCFSFFLFLQFKLKLIIFCSSNEVNLISKYKSQEQMLQNLKALLSWQHIHMYFAFNLHSITWMSAIPVMKNISEHYSTQHDYIRLYVSVKSKSAPPPHSPGVPQAFEERLALHSGKFYAKRGNLYPSSWVDGVMAYFIEFARFIFMVIVFVYITSLR